MNDLISRQAAIDTLWEIRREEIIDGRRFENHCSLSTAVDVIRDLPSAQPEQQWIPCSERLPEVGTYVLISKKALNFRSSLPNVCTAHRSCDPRSGKEEWNDMLFGKLDDDDVFAWMPLPEPYKEDAS